MGAASDSGGVRERQKLSISTTSSPDFLSVKCYFWHIRICPNSISRNVLLPGRDPLAVEAVLLFLATGVDPEVAKGASAEALEREAR